MRLKYFCLGLTFLWSQAFAHPVIYADGVMWGQMMTPSMTDLQLSYSFRYDWAVGVNAWRFENPSEQSHEFALAKLNHLLKRWNNPDSQGNIYLHSGIGAGRNHDNETSFAWSGGVEADWESRVWFLSGKWLHLADDFSHHNLYVARFGHSPILADFNSLQVWFMAQAMYQKEMSRSLVITPLLRFFYHNVLWEMGASLDGEWMLSFMIHY